MSLCGEACDVRMFSFQENYSADSLTLTIVRASKTTQNKRSALVQRVCERQRMVFPRWWIAKFSHPSFHPHPHPTLTQIIHCNYVWVVAVRAATSTSVISPTFNDWSPRTRRKEKKITGDTIHEAACVSFRSILPSSIHLWLSIETWTLTVKLEITSCVHLNWIVFVFGWWQQRWLRHIWWKFIYSINSVFDCWAVRRWVYTTYKS